MTQTDFIITLNIPVNKSNMNSTYEKGYLSRSGFISAFQTLGLSCKCLANLENPENESSPLKFKI